jgi:hypothetical protein
MEQKNYTRREFLKNSASAAAAGAFVFSLPKCQSLGHSNQNRVVLIRHKDVLDDLHKPNAEIVQQMLDEAVTTLLGKKTPAAAWKKIIKPDDIVGIKSNVWRYLPTPKPLEDAIKKRVMEAGVLEESISIRDRGLRRDPIFQKATAFINTRPMRTHHWSGVGTLLKNYVTFLNNIPEYHPDSCADLAAIWKLPHIQGKTRLNVLVMFTPLFHGTGPHHFNPEYVWPYKGLLVGFDPVAVDATGVRILQAKRREYFDEDRPLNPPAKHIFLADTRHHLGTADPAKIELIKLGWEENSLI